MKRGAIAKFYGISTRKLSTWLKRYDELDDLKGLQEFTPEQVGRIDKRLSYHGEDDE